MTDKQFEEAKRLKVQIEQLFEESHFFYLNPELERDICTFWISGMHKEGDTSTLFVIDDELLEVIKQWYSDKIEMLEKQFEEM